MNLLSTWFLLYGLAGVGAALLGLSLLGAIRPPGREGAAIDGGLGAAIGVLVGLFLVGLGAFSLPHVLLAFLHFRTARFRAGWSRGLSLAHTVLWVLVSIDASSERGLGYTFFTREHPWASAVAVSITLLHGLATILSFRLKGAPERGAVEGD